MNQGGAPGGSKWNGLLSLAGGGDNWVKLATIGLIGMSGLGNLWTTRQSSSVTDREVEINRREIHELYEAVRRNADEFHANNEDSKKAREAAEAILEKLNQK